MAITLAEYQTWLDEAERALHTLMTGAAIADVWRDGRRITYTARNRADLEAYIRLLRDAVRDMQATDAGTRRRRPMPVRFV